MSSDAERRLAAKIRQCRREARDADQALQYADAAARAAHRRLRAAEEKREARRDVAAALARMHAQHREQYRWLNWQQHQERIAARGSADAALVRARHDSEMRCFINASEREARAACAAARRLEQ